jgi:predicted nucleotidyltransferase
MEARARIEEELQRWPQIRFALLYGSRAHGRPRPDSDWDVAIYLDDALDAGERLDVQRRIVAGLAPAVPIDLVVLNEAPPLLGHRALRGERLLVRDKSFYTRYFVKTVGMALDQAPMARFHAEARRKRLQERDVG